MEKVLSEWIHTARLPTQGDKNGTMHPMRIHLVRHGHVYNPRDLVYAALPGFHLSPDGQRQADAVAEKLRARPIVRIVSSPLDRAIETAAPLAERFGLPITVDPDLTEWRMLDRWAGHTWEALQTTFPGEVDAYLFDPANLDFTDESLSDLAERCAFAVLRHATAGGDTVFVSHQDPVEALTRRLTSATLDNFHTNKPGHGEVRSLVSNSTGWTAETEPR